MGPEGVQVNSCIQRSISLDMVDADHEQYIAYMIESMKRDAAIQVFDEIFKANHPTVVDTHLETYTDYASYSLVYRIHFRLMAVRTMNVTMPTMEPFIFTNYVGQVEWKCPFCAVINNIEATFCGELHHNAVGCGHPREKTRQEMNV